MEDKRVEREKRLWNKLAAGYDTQPGIGDLRMYRDLLKHIGSLLKPTDAVLEIACGTGIIALDIAPTVESVVGIDVSEKMIEVADGKLRRTGLQNVRFLVGDGYHLPFADASSDAVLLCNVLHVVEDPSRLLQESKRVLKPNGLLITSTDCYRQHETLKSRLQYVATVLANKLGIIPCLSWFTEKDLHELIRDNGFEVSSHQTLRYMGMIGAFVVAKPKVGQGDGGARQARSPVKHLRP